ncbi:twin-arginine translocase subunit TatC [Thaumasiovibrio subtropicus]|uniref:twin-arginine translocase subunit TatC n=1 Tax=Thaumasiovibrio subtropicus TaxID=1891207 RepID=UPI000B352C5C|nr:twin-arginine translocase subunit TatC [Thaumasiovibrio subtropicus]
MTPHRFRDTVSTLRARLLQSAIVLIALFSTLVVFRNDIYYLVAMPLLDQLPQNTSMIATDVTAPLLAPIKLTFFVAAYLAMPFFLYQLHVSLRHSRVGQNLSLPLWPLSVAAMTLFYLGSAFAYGVVLPLAIQFLTSVAPEGVVVATDIRQYLSFVLTLLWAFGFAFQIPIVVILLCWSRITSIEKLKAARGYVLISAFIVAMIMTPPDLISQTLLAIPMLVLFEIGLLGARWYQPSTIN